MRLYLTGPVTDEVLSQSTGSAVDSVHIYWPSEHIDALQAQANACGEHGEGKRAT